MTKLQLSALSLIIIATVGLTISRFSNDNSNQTTNTSATEQSQSESRALSDEKSPVNLARIDRSELPAGHGIADENGQQIHQGDQPRRLPPPPPVSAPDSQHNKIQTSSASQHGHEKSHSTEQESTPPPPVGANKI